MKQLSLMIVLFVLSISSLIAQTKVVSGRVTSSVQGEGVIPGVTVTVKGTNLGALTDVNGRFSITAPQNASTIVFSYIGMKTQEIDIAGRSVIDVVMESDVLGLNEVVVTALGIKRESKALGYSVQSVSNDQIAKSNNTDIINSLAGKVAGVHITPSSGAAGASTFIEIRGSTSLTGNNQPLFVVDGIPIQTGGGEGDVADVNWSDRAVDLNPDDIETITVLKGGAATALYGLRASNGVILITTKKGTNDTKMKIDFHTALTFDKISHTQAIQNKYTQGSATGYVGYLEWAYGQPFNHVASPTDGQPYRNVSWGARIDTCSYTTDPTWVAPDDNIYNYLDMADYLKYWDANGRIVSANDPKANGKPVNVYDPYSFFKTGVTTSNSLSLSGGSTTTTYFVSISNESQDGIIPNNTFKRTTFKLSGDTKLFRNLTSSASVTFINSLGNRQQQGSNVSGVMLGLVRTPPTFDNAAGYIFSDGTQRNYRGGGGYDNPYWTVNENIYKDNVNRLIGNLSFNYDATSWLNFSYRVGTDWYTYGYKNYFAQHSCAYPAGEVNTNRSLNQDINSDLIMSIKKGLGQSFFFTLTAGNNLYMSTSNTVWGVANGISVPDFYNLSNSSSVNTYEYNYEKRTAAFFGDLGISYKSMIYINGTGREEWSTTMPVNANKFFYPSVSAGFVFTELPFLKDNKILSFGKLRSSLAIVANDAGAYNTTTNYYQAGAGDGWTQGVTFPFLGKSGFTYGDQMGNNLLKPEKMKSFEVGTELRFFMNRLSLDVAYFNNQNSDLLLSVPVAPSTGFSTKYTNAGTMKTTGVDLLFNAAIIKTSSFKWDISVNFSNPRSIVTRLAPGVESIFLGGFNDPQIRAVAGQPYRSIYGIKLLRDPVSGKLIINDDASLDDPNVYGPGVYGYPMASTEVGNMGTVQPDWTMGITNTFSFKGFSLTGLIDIKHGGKMWNGTNGAMVYFGTSVQTLNRDISYVHSGLLGHLNSSGEIVHFAADGKTELPGPGAVNTISRPDDENYCYWNGIGSGFIGPSEPFIESIQFVRLREITFSYAVNAKMLKNTPIKNLDVYVTGRNLWIKTPYSGIDPETSLLGASNGQGLDYFNMPGTNAMTFGLRIGF
ncbi:MAG: SusC/RagA family TonB-linked outer membrane protein [Bacteroidales bacterium]